MSKRNMRKYIFYEVIIVGIVALAISLVAGIVALLGLSIVVYKQIGTFLFVDAFIKSLSYICVLLFITVCFVYLSILPISVHSMDSLIHKKERKIMKKYHKAKKMSVFNLSEKMSGRYSQYISALAALILVQAICLSAINSYSQYFDNIVPKDSHGQYSYLLNCKDEAFYENMSDVIIDYRYVTYVEKDLDSNSNYVFYKLEGLEHLLKEGRFPQNNRECLVFETDRYNYSESYKIGNTINVILSGGYIYDENGNVISSDAKIAPMTIVGSIDLENYYEIREQTTYRFPAGGRMFAVYEDAFDKEDWKDYTYLKTSKDIFFQLNELSSQYNHRDHSSNRVDYNNLYFFGDISNTNSQTFVTDQMLIYVPVIAISVLFVVFIIRLLVDKLNKDYKLVRCLGMTFEQTMFSYMYIGITFTILPMGYYIFTFINRYNYYLQLDILELQMSELLFPVILISVLCALHFAGFMIYAYKKTSSTVTFYPTDVERYY